MIFLLLMDTYHWDLGPKTTELLNVVRGLRKVVNHQSLLTFKFYSGLVSRPPAWIGNYSQLKIFISTMKMPISTTNAATKKLIETHWLFDCVPDHNYVKKHLRLCFNRIIFQTFAVIITHTHQQVFRWKARVTRCQLIILSMSNKFVLDDCETKCIIKPLDNGYRGLESAIKFRN